MSSDLHQALAAPFTNGDLEWKVQTCGKKGEKIWALVVPYLSARAIQSRLDEVVGPGCWRNRYEPILKGGDVAGFLCYLAIKIGDEWVEKCDGAELTDIEPVKGGLSNSLKRVAVQWGLGRFLYSIDTCWANVHPNGKEKGKTKDGDWFQWDPPTLHVGATPAAAPPAAKAAAPSKVVEAPKAAPAQPAAPVVGDANELAAKTAHGFLAKASTKDFADLVWRSAVKGDIADRISLLTKASESIARITEVLGARGEEMITDIIRAQKPGRDIVADLASAALGEVAGKGA